MAQKRKTHEDTALTYVGRRGDIVTFGAPSRSNPQHTNLVSLDVTTGETHCTCKYCETHPETVGGCWLTQSIAAAWYAHQYSLVSDGRQQALDREYAARQPFLDAEQIARWGLIVDEMSRRFIQAGSAAGRRAARARGAAAKADLFDDAATEAGNVFEAAMVGAG